MWVDGGACTTNIESNMRNGNEILGVNQMYVVHVPLTTLNSVNELQRVKSDENRFHGFMKHRCYVTKYPFPTQILYKVLVLVPLLT